MGKPSRDKGQRRERQVVALHVDFGIRAERVPLSGASRYRGNGGDVDIYPWSPEGPVLCGEVKARRNGAGFVTLERWLGENDMLFLVRDRQEPMVVLPWGTWRRLLKR